MMAMLVLIAYNFEHVLHESSLSLSLLPPPCPLLTNYPFSIVHNPIVKEDKIQTVIRDLASCSLLINTVCFFHTGQSTTFDL